jgi:hypothetical protein
MPFKINVIRTGWFSAFLAKYGPEQWDELVQNLNKLAQQKKQKITNKRSLFCPVIQEA